MSAVSEVLKFFPEEIFNLLWKALRVTFRFAILYLESKE